MIGIQLPQDGCKLVEVTTFGGGATGTETVLPEVTEQEGLLAGWAGHVQLPSITGSSNERRESLNRFTRSGFGGIQEYACLGMQAAPLRALHEKDRQNHPDPVLQAQAM